MTRRGAARLGAIQALYQLEMTGRDVDAVIREFERYRLGDLLEPLDGDGPAPAVDRAWFHTLTLGAWQRAPELDPAIEAALAEGWSLLRAGYLLRACLRAGAYELADRADVPTRVVIDEYVGLARTFLSAGDAGFVNAVLDRLAREFRREAEAAGPPPAPA